MKNLLALLVMSLLCSAAGCRRQPEAPPDNRVVRCAVIGGMTMSGLWPEIARRFEAHTGYRVQVVATGPRPILDEAMRQGQVDLLTMHSGDITTDLIADGICVNMRPWTRNELVLLGPPEDPAGVRGMTNGAAALRRIGKSKSRFVDFQGVGSREMTHTLWRLAGIEPKGEWVLKDETESKFDILQFARSNQAYVIVGYMPAHFGKMNSTGMEVMVQGDPAMRRPYIVMEANPKRFPNANATGARALSDFLLSESTQSFLREFGRGAHDGGRALFFPVER